MYKKKTVKNTKNLNKYKNLIKNTIKRKNVQKKNK